MITRRLRPYRQQIWPSIPACYLFIIDQSSEMMNRVGGNGLPMAEQLAHSMNFWLNALITKTTTGAGVVDFMEVAVISYHSDDHGMPVVRTALGAGLAQISTDRFLGISQIAKHPLRVTRKTMQIYDPETSESLVVPVESTEWVDPKSSGLRPTRNAFMLAHAMLSEWTGGHRDSFPTIVIHITGGPSDDGDPSDWAAAVNRLGTDHGQVLLCHQLLSADPRQEQVLFPHEENQLCSS